MGYTNVMSETAVTDIATFYASRAAARRCASTMLAIWPALSAVSRRVTRRRATSLVASGMLRWNGRSICCSDGSAVSLSSISRSAPATSACRPGPLRRTSSRWLRRRQRRLLLNFYPTTLLRLILSAATPIFNGSAASTRGIGLQYTRPRSAR
jgi:hypothetical protein